MTKKRILVARLSRGSMLESRDKKIAELNESKDQILERYSDNFVESQDTIYHYCIVNVDLNTTAFAGFDIIDAGPVLKKLETEMTFIQGKENIDTEQRVDNKLDPDPEPAKVSGTKIDGKYSGQTVGAPEPNSAKVSEVKSDPVEEPVKETVDEPKNEPESIPEQPESEKNEEDDKVDESKKEAQEEPVKA